MFEEGYFGKLEENASRKVKAEREHCEQIINLVTELLELERIESSGKLKLALDHCDLYRVMFNAVGTIQNLATHKGLRINLIPCSIGLVADKVRIRQLIINLLSNAIKYSPNNGEVKIFAERIDAENICIRIEDEGRGIPVEMRTSIFERFKQVKDADRETGSGIGLAICKAIAEAHGGAVGVDARPEGGSSFWVKLPAEIDDDDDDIP